MNSTQVSAIKKMVIGNIIDGIKQNMAEEVDIPSG